jgi:hypothetical protein
VRMPNGLERMLDALDLVIEKHSLHLGDPRAPIVVDQLLESAILRRWYLPEPCSAVSVQIGVDASVTLNKDLLEVCRSADDRHAKAHEYGHIHREHQGYQIMWRASWSRGTPFERYLRTREERECEVISAYLLVSARALYAMRDQDIGYVASMLDVPIHLVALRQEIWAKYHR